MGVAVQPRAAVGHALLHALAAQADAAAQVANVGDVRQVDVARRQVHRLERSLGRLAATLHGPCVVAGDFEVPHDDRRL